MTFLTIQRMHIPLIREKLSWSSVQIKASFNDTQISAATGFFYEFDKREFLITNWHVASGRNPTTDKPLHCMAAIPDSLDTCVPRSRQIKVDGSGRQQSGLTWEWKRLPLFNDSNYERPIWTEHPKHGKLFHVVAIPLSGLVNTSILAVNSPEIGLEKIRIYPGLEAFVIGFPLGMTGGANFPIWKRATIASEPDIHIDGLPKFLIDTATREGMSGSPVFAQEVGYWLQEGETDTAKANFGKGLRFVGIYSGRIGADDEFKAQLGLVWKESALVELLKNVRE